MISSIINYILRVRTNLILLTNAPESPSVDSIHTASRTTALLTLGVFQTFSVQANTVLVLVAVRVVSAEQEAILLGKEGIGISLYNDV